MHHILQRATDFDDVLSPSPLEHPAPVHRLIKAFRGNEKGLLSLFRRFDGKHTGYISVDVFGSLMELKGVSLTHAECQEVATYLDP